MTARFDLVVFGATGFTGRQACLHLARHAPPALRWAIGGRDRGRLEALAARLEGPAPPAGVLVADAANLASVRLLVSNARVVLQLAGPYGRFGENFVAACVENRCDYIDLSGEIGWVRRMIDAYDRRAADAGLRLVPVCGFEALPYDMAALIAASKLLERHGRRAAALDIVTEITGPGFRRPADAISGGTAATIGALLAAGPSAPITDPAILIDDPAAAARLRNGNRYRISARHSDKLGGWLVPMLPAPFVNPPVVLRSAALLGPAHARDGGVGLFDPDFRYTESLLIPGSGVGRRIAAQVLAAAFRAALSSADGSGVMGRFGRKAGSRLIERFGPRSGEGPSDEMLERTGYRMRITCTAATGEAVRGTAVGIGHPGYRSTASLVAELGMLLASADESLPRRRGVLTPATAFGLAGVEAMRRGGLEFGFAP